VPSKLGEMYQFNYEMMLRHLLKTFKLYDIAQQESVEICRTLDGAELTKDLCHLSFGVKITDPPTVDPRDGTPLVYSHEGIIGNIFKVQSCNYCFILKTLLGRDSKAAYHEFADVFKFFENLMKDGLPANQYGPRIVPIIVWSPQDLSRIWKSLNTGSGTRKAGTRHWCYLCACTSDKIASYSVGDNRLDKTLFISLYYFSFSPYLIFYFLFIYHLGVKNVLRKMQKNVATGLLALKIPWCNFSKSWVTNWQSTSNLLAEL